MRVLVYSTRPYDRQYLTAANRRGEHELHFTEARLNAQTVALAGGYSAVCCLVGDTLDREVLQQLAKGGTRLVALRSSVLDIYGRAS